MNIDSQRPIALPLDFNSFPDAVSNRLLARSVYHSELAKIATNTLTHATSIEVNHLLLRSIVTLTIVCWSYASHAVAQAPIQHDAEHYVLLHQYKDKWAAEDKELDQKLAELRAKNGGKRPNIVYILIDDIGFGDLGSKTLNMIRGYETPSAIAEASVRNQPSSVYLSS